MAKPSPEQNEQDVLGYLKTLGPGAELPGSGAHINPAGELDFYLEPQPQKKTSPPLEAKEDEISTRSTMGQNSTFFNVGDTGF